MGLNGEKQNKQYFKETFNEVHAPQSLAEMITNMNNLKSKSKKTGFAVKIAVAAVVFLLVASNVAAYAVTGNTWIETIFTGPSAKLVVEDDGIYILDGDTKINVTETLGKNGMATGSYEVNGYTKIYTIFEENGQHVLDIRYDYGDIDTKDADGVLTHAGMVIAGTPTPTP